MNKIYVCIDLKSFYASVECVERNLDPLNTNLVVADSSRTQKTICLAVSPSLKSYGIGGRCRLFELVSLVSKVNQDRKRKNRYRDFTRKSYIASELKKDNTLEMDYIVAPPRMSYYMDYSTKIYNVYLKYIAPEDIYVYSIDEVFIDITSYLKYYNLSPRELVTKMIKDVYDTTGITATGGIGTNMYLAKVAMDIVAKHAHPNQYGVRIAGLDEMTYRKLLWNHTPLTDFWRVGKGISDKLNKIGIYTMGDIALLSESNEDLLYKKFGVNAELLIDHAWGYEPCTIKDIKMYKPLAKSISTGQVLHDKTKYEDTIIIIKEMADQLGLDLFNKRLTTNQIILTIEYDVENLKDEIGQSKYNGEISTDYLGRKVPKHAHGTINLEYYTNSSIIIMKKSLELFSKIINKDLYTRKIYIVASNLLGEESSANQVVSKQMDLFSLNNNPKKELEYSKEEELKEKEIQQVISDIKNKYGKNSILKGMNLTKGATAIERNKQIGGHHE